MGIGGLAVIIPPSALTVLLATLGQTDVGALLIAGVIPGFVLAAMYGVLIWAWVVIDPKAAPPYEVQSITTREKLRIFFIDVIPMVAIIVFSVLIMLVGWCTPTEAAALGAVSVIALAACYGEMTWQAFRKSLDGALRVTVMAFLVIFGSATFGQVLAFSGASSGLLNWAISFQVTPIEMLYIMIGVIIFLGSFMDPLSKMLLTAPIFFPLAKSLGFDLTWFGLIMLLSLEMGYTMPPFGLLLFVMKGVSPPGTRMRDIYLAGMPFIACVVLLILLVIYIPPLATWLPAVSH
jgi:tripartite ATP-independent transporter DctM subunit